MIQNDIQNDVHNLKWKTKTCIKIGTNNCPKWAWTQGVEIKPRGAKSIKIKPQGRNQSLEFEIKPWAPKSSPWGEIKPGGQNQAWAVGIKPQNRNQALATSSSTANLRTPCMIVANTVSPMHRHTSSRTLLVSSKKDTHVPCMAAHQTSLMVTTMRTALSMLMIASKVRAFSMLQVGKVPSPAKSCETRLKHLLHNAQKNCVALENACELFLGKSAGVPSSAQWWTGPTMWKRAPLPASN